VQKVSSQAENFFTFKKSLLVEKASSDSISQLLSFKKSFLVQRVSDKFILSFEA